MLKEIYAARDYGEAVITISLLRASGFHPLEPRQFTHISFEGGDLYYYIQVPDEESESATEFLKNEGFKI